MVKLVHFSIDHVEDFIREETDMPDELVRKVSGTKAFEQTLPQVWPIQHYPITEVAQASLRMCDSHRTRWPNERMLHQVSAHTSCIKKIYRICCLQTLIIMVEYGIFEYGLYLSQVISPSPGQKSCKSCCQSQSLCL